LRGLLAGSRQRLLLPQERGVFLLQTLAQLCQVALFVLHAAGRLGQARLHLAQLLGEGRLRSADLGQQCVALLFPVLPQRVLFRLVSGVALGQGARLLIEELLRFLVPPCQGGLTRPEVHRHEQQDQRAHGA
jgi:hypothetical protein